MTNASIILAGQQPNMLGAVKQGQDMAAAQGVRARENALNKLFLAQGADIAAGKPEALNALAMLDPSATLGVQKERLGMDQTRNTMRNQNARTEIARGGLAVSQGNLKLAQERAKREVAAFAADMSAQEAQAAQAKLQSTYQGLSQVGTKEAWDAQLIRNGYDPANHPFESRDVLLAEVLGAKEALEAVSVGDDATAAADLPAGIQSLQWRAEQAGLVPGTPAYQEFMVNGGKQQRGMRLTTNPDGSVTFEEGDLSETGGRMKPSDPQFMIDSIDGILNDPALGMATGWTSWTQKIPDSGPRRFAAKARQLEGQAFLQAFESLKGAGQITEIEGQKATQAIGRLDTSQSAKDYREALTDLREVLVTAQHRMNGGQQVDTGISPQAISNMTREQFNAVNPAEMANWPDEVLDAYIAKGQSFR